MKLIPLFLIACIVFPALAEGQCRAFHKNKCAPLLSGFTESNSMNAVLTPGESAEALITFYGGKEYRLVVMPHPILGDADFEITDTNGDSIYKANTASESTFDFKMASTQQLIVKVHVAQRQSSIGAHEGCVCLAAGSKSFK